MLIADMDGTYSGRLSPPAEARFLYWMSWWGMFTGLVGAWNGWVWPGGGVCLGSIFAQLYWLDPTYSWRRTLDMTWIQMLIWSHAYLAWVSPVFWPYFAIQLIGASFYGVSWWFIRRRQSWPATLTHAAVHMCANVSLLVLYLTP